MWTVTEIQMIKLQQLLKNDVEGTELLNIITKNKPISERIAGFEVLDRNVAEDFWVFVKTDEHIVVDLTKHWDNWKDDDLEKQFEAVGYELTDAGDNYGLLVKL